MRLYLKPHVGGVPLRELTVSRVTKLWADRGRDGMAASTVKKCSEVFATAMESAVSEERIPVAPTANAAKPKVIRGDVEVFTDEEVRALIAAAAGNRFEALFLIAFGTGAREGDILALESTDFDLAAGTVRITKKLDQGKEGFRLQPPKSRAGARRIGDKIETVMRAYAHWIHTRPGHRRPHRGHLRRQARGSRQEARQEGQEGVVRRR